MTTIYVQNKSDLPKRHENDLYRTEYNLIRAALLPLYYDFDDINQQFKVLDVGAGDGRWGFTAQNMWPNAIFTGIELDDKPNPGFDFWFPNTNALEWGGDAKYDIILSNPPYYIAEEIIRKFHALLNPGGRMVFLLRLAFQAGVGRYENLWNELSPYNVSVLSRRPSFYNGKTNGTDYGVYYWGKTLSDKNLGLSRKWTTDLLYYERDEIND